MEELNGSKGGMMNVGGPVDSIGEVMLLSVVLVCVVAFLWWCMWGGPEAVWRYARHRWCAWFHFSYCEIGCTYIRCSKCGRLVAGVYGDEGMERIPEDEYSTPEEWFKAVMRRS